jgi:hypothetical protein
MECQICCKKGGDIDTSCFLCNGTLCTACFMKHQSRQKCVLCKQWWFVETVGGFVETVTASHTNDNKK